MEKKISKAINHLNKTIGVALSKRTIVYYEQLEATESYDVAKEALLEMVGESEKTQQTWIARRISTLNDVDKVNLTEEEFTALLPKEKESYSDKKQALKNIIDICNLETMIKFSKYLHQYDDLMMVIHKEEEGSSQLCQ